MVVACQNLPPHTALPRADTPLDTQYTMQLAAVERRQVRQQHRLSPRPCSRRDEQVLPEERGLKRRQRGILRSRLMSVITWAVAVPRASGVSGRGVSVHL
jgi:hypothetical protein